eukprot:1739347-Pyramimonas_sp.AAC.1
MRRDYPTPPSGYSQEWPFAGVALGALLPAATGAVPAASNSSSARRPRATGHSCRRPAWRAAGPTGAQLIGPRARLGVQGPT